MTAPTTPEALAAALVAMHPAQAAYALASAAHAVIVAELNARSAAAEPADATDEAAIDAWCDLCEDARTELGADASLARLAVAEDALLEWSFRVAHAEILRSRRTAAKRKTDALAVRALADRAEVDVLVRARCLEIAMRLEPGSPTL